MKFSTPFSQIPGWHKGAKIGAILGTILAFAGMLFLTINDSGSERWSWQTLLMSVNGGLVGLCLGGVVGRMCGTHPMPYWLKVASVTTVLPVAYLMIMAFQPNIGMMFMAIVAYLALAPIPLFVFGTLIGLIIDKIVSKRRIPLNSQ